jgi:hypothetical protein
LHYSLIKKNAKNFDKYLVIKYRNRFWLKKQNERTFSLKRGLCTPVPLGVKLAEFLNSTSSFTLLIINMLKFQAELLGNRGKLLAIPTKHHPKEVNHTQIYVKYQLK